MDFLHIIDQLNVLIEHSASQWWIIPLVSLFCLIDGFFLFLPSETAIVALASIATRTGEPNVYLLILGASIGAILGDNVAYFLGRTLGTTRFKWMRRPRGAKAFAWAGRELEKRGAILIFTARYVPIGRVAVNFTAGATHFPWRRFVILDGIAVVTWATYSAAMGTFAGHWVHDNPLLGVGIAIAFAVIVGIIVDHLMKVLHHHLEKRGKIEPRPEPGSKAAELAAIVQAQVEAERRAAARAVASETPSGPDATGPADSSSASGAPSTAKPSHPKPTHANSTQEKSARGESWEDEPSSESEGFTADAIVSAEISNSTCTVTGHADTALGAAPTANAAPPAGPKNRGPGQHSRPGKTAAVGPVGHTSGG